MAHPRSAAHSGIEPTTTSPTFSGTWWTAFLSRSPSSYAVIPDVPRTPGWNSRAGIVSSSPTKRPESALFLVPVRSYFYGGSYWDGHWYFSSGGHVWRCRSRDRVPDSGSAERDECCSVGSKPGLMSHIISRTAGLDIALIRPRHDTSTGITPTVRLISFSTTSADSPALVQFARQLHSPPVSLLAPQSQYRDLPTHVHVAIQRQISMIQSKRRSSSNKRGVWTGPLAHHDMSVAWAPQSQYLDLWRQDTATDANDPEGANSS